MNQLELENLDTLNYLLDKYHIRREALPLDWLCDTSFFKDPASTRYHLNVPGGLFQHSLNVTLSLVKTLHCDPSLWGRPESPFIVGMLHDVTKIGKYKISSDMNMMTDELEIMYEYNKDYINYGGHGEDSVIKVLQHMDLTEEELLCIRYHMGAYEKDDWEGFDKAIRKYPMVLYTHTADMLASKVVEE